MTKVQLWESFLFIFFITNSSLEEGCLKRSFQHEFWNTSQLLPFLPSLSCGSQHLWWRIARKYPNSLSLKFLFSLRLFYTQWCNFLDNFRISSEVNMMDGILNSLIFLHSQAVRGSLGDQNFSSASYTVLRRPTVNGFPLT